MLIKQLLQSTMDCVDSQWLLVIFIIIFIIIMLDQMREGLYKKAGFLPCHSIQYNSYWPYSFLCVKKKKKKLEKQKWIRIHLILKES